MDFLKFLLRVINLVKELYLTSFLEFSLKEIEICNYQSLTIIGYCWCLIFRNRSSMSCKVLARKPQ